MEQQAKRILDRLYPEIKSGLHLPVLAVVVAISDPMHKPELAKEFRPRYGVDVQVLTPEGKADDQLLIFRTVLSRGIGVPALDREDLIAVVSARDTLSPWKRAEAEARGGD